MPTWPETLALAAVAAAFCTASGLPLARLLAPAGFPALGLAPVLGWAIFSVVALPVLTVTGFGRLQTCLLCLVWLGAVWRFVPRARAVVRLPVWAAAAAALVAILPVLALMPKHAAGGLVLAAPMFDHVKVAIIDGIVRSGLPVRNPFISLPGTDRLAYYYLWHFSAAVLARAFRVRGWAADAAMAGATSWASLMLIMGLARMTARRDLACAVVACLALAGTLRPVLNALLGWRLAAGVIVRDADLEGWLFQAAWVPQHLASASCVVLAVLLLMRLAEGGGWLVSGALGLVVAAGFESSAWVGGVTFALVAPMVSVLLLLGMARDRRVGFALCAGAAALITVAFILPFLRLQVAAVAARHGGTPVALMPYGVLGWVVPAAWRAVLDVPAFWLLALPAGLPALLPGAACLLTMMRRRRQAGAGVWAVAAVASLGVASLLRSVIDNNDLGWRAELPAVLVLMGVTGGVAARLVVGRRWMAVVVAAACFLLSLPDGAGVVRAFAAGDASDEAGALAASPAMWAAVRHATGKEERVLDNPAFLAGVTPWEDNISWALFSDRPSCFSGWQSVVAYGALPRAGLDGLDAMVKRVFAGKPRAGDLAALVGQFGCRVFVVSPRDGAWSADPFAEQMGFALVEGKPLWRIYRWSSNQ